MNTKPAQASPVESSAETAPEEFPAIDDEAVELEGFNLDGGHEHADTVAVPLHLDEAVAVRSDE